MSKATHKRPGNCAEPSAEAATIRPVRRGCLVLLVSAAVNPAMTVTAQALRAAEHMLATDLRASARATAKQVASSDPIAAPLEA